MSVSLSGGAPSMSPSKANTLFLKKNSFTFLFFIIAAAFIIGIIYLMMKTTKRTNTPTVMSSQRNRSRKR